MIPYQPTLDHAEKVSRSVEQIQLAAAMSERYYGKPLLVCYSGGKDSDALLGVAQMAGIDFEVMHSLTTADAPETEHDRRWRRLVAERKKRVEDALADGRITEEHAARLIELADTVSGFEAVFSAYTRKGDAR